MTFSGGFLRMVLEFQYLNWNFKEQYSVYIYMHTLACLWTDRQHFSSEYKACVCWIKIKGEMKL